MTAFSPVLLLAVWTGIIAAGLCLGRLLWVFLWIGARAVWRGLGPWQPGRADQRVPRIAPGAEPAHLGYYWRQLWVDAASAGGYGIRVVWAAFTDPWLHRNVRNLFQGRHPSGLRGRAPINRFGYAVLLAPGVFFGALLGAALATVLLGVSLVFFALLVGLVWLGCATAVPVLRGVERGRALARGIRVKCPYPGCYLPVPLAVHRCPGCRASHASLRPGRYGVLWHHCACGHRLPTTRLAGRGALTALCPHCDRVLPETVGSTRVVHAPLVGGTSSGKTMLMAAMVEGLHAWERHGDLRRFTDAPTGLGGPEQEVPGPLTGENFRGWSDRLRDVEEMVSDPTLRAWLDSQHNSVVRRVKHFSGYLVTAAYASGRGGIGDASY